MSPIEMCPGASAGDATTTTAYEVADAQHTVRCRRCRRRVWAPRSVSRACGPTCWRQLRFEEELCNAVAEFADELVAI
jgi:Family of unknown function (DUF6011)